MQRAEGVKIAHSHGWLRRTVWVTVNVGRDTYRVVKIHRDRFAELQANQQTKPVLIVTVGERSFWQYQGRHYSTTTASPPARSTPC